MATGPVIEKALETASTMKWFKEIRFGEVLLLIVLLAIGYGAWVGVPKYLADDREDRKAAATACETEKAAARDDFVKSLASQQATFERTLDRFEGKHLKAAATRAAAKEDGKDG